MTQTQGQIGYLPQAFASKIAIWIADRVASRLGLLCTRVALNDERARGNDVIVNKDRTRTRFIATDGDEFVVRWSPETAGHYADYRELGRFPTRAEAEAFLATR